MMAHIGADWREVIQQPHAPATNEAQPSAIGMHVTVRQPGRLENLLPGTPHQDKNKTLNSCMHVQQLQSW